VLVCRKLIIIHRCFKGCHAISTPLPHSLIIFVLIFIEFHCEISLKSGKNPTAPTFCHNINRGFTCVGTLKIEKHMEWSLENLVTVIIPVFFRINLNILSMFYAQCDNKGSMYKLAVKVIGDVNSACAGSHLNLMTPYFQFISTNL
jgi:hypothetical protein